MARFMTLSGASKAERLAARASHLRAYPGARLAPGPAGGAAYTYERHGKLLALFFWGSSAKPLHHVVYRDEQRRGEAVAAFHASLRSRAERKAGRRADLKAWQNPAKVGDILYTSWGYDQTNVEWYAVTRVSGKRVWVREIVGDYEGTGFMSGKTWPSMPIRFCEKAEETMHTARPSDRGYAIKISESQTAWLTDGSPKHTSSYA